MILQHIFLQTIRFAGEPFDTIAIDGLFKIAGSLTKPRL